MCCDPWISFYDRRNFVYWKENGLIDLDRILDVLIIWWKNLKWLMCMISSSVIMIEIEIRIGMIWALVISHGHFRGIEIWKGYR